MRTKLPPPEQIEADRARSVARFGYLSMAEFTAKIGKSRPEARALIRSGKIHGVVDLTPNDTWPRYMIPPAGAERFLAEEKAAAECRAEEAGCRAQAAALRAGVYIVRAEGLARYKIGISGCIDQRLQGFRTALPVSVALVAFLPHATSDVERALHERFASTRVHGEWFSESPDLLAFIEEHRP